jgi:hypothetical protein
MFNGSYDGISVNPWYGRLGKPVGSQPRDTGAEGLGRTLELLGSISRT